MAQAQAETTPTTTPNSDLPKLGSESAAQLTTPALWTDEGKPHPAWSTPATEEDYAEAAKHLIAAVEPEASEQRSKMIYRLLKTREYSRAELLLVMQELPFDPEAAHNYGKGFNPADVERIIDEHRKTRTRLQQPLSSEQRDEIIAEHPEEIDPDAFHCCGFNEYDEPLWRYAPDADAEPREPTPELPEHQPGAARQESDTGGSTVDFGKLIEEIPDENE